MYSEHMLSRTLNWYLTITLSLLNSLIHFYFGSVLRFVSVDDFVHSRRIAGTPRAPPPPRRLGTAFRPTLFPGISTRGTPPMVLGSFINDTSS